MIKGLKGLGWLDDEDGDGEKKINNTSSNGKGEEAEDYLELLGFMPSGITPFLSPEGGREHQKMHYIC